jgi:hypothetical protein
MPFEQQFRQVTLGEADTRELDALMAKEKRTPEQTGKMQAFAMRSDNRRQQESSRLAAQDRERRQARKPPKAKKKAAQGNDSAWADFVEGR